MVEEIFLCGPITCTIALTQELYNYTGRIFQDYNWRKNRDQKLMSLVKEKKMELNIGMHLLVLPIRIF